MLWRWLHRSFHFRTPISAAPRRSSLLLHTRCTHPDNLTKLQKAVASLQHQGLPTDPTHCSWLLQECGRLGALPQGKLVHACCRENGLDRHRLMGNHLISMYSKCGSVEDAIRVFEAMAGRDVSSWNAMIGAFVQHNLAKMAFQLYERMKAEGWKPNNITAVSLLSACSGPETLAQGRMLHADIVDCRFGSDVIAGTALVRMYANCGKLESAVEVFERLPERNIRTWTAMIVALVQHGHFDGALQLFRLMQLEGLMPNDFSLVSILGACASPEALEQGSLIHAQIVRNGFEDDVVVGNAIINMYAKCCSLIDAIQVFEQMPERNVASWTAILAANAKQAQAETALKFFSEMQYQGLKPNHITIVSLLGGFCRPTHLFHGRMLHAHFVGDGDTLDLNVIVMNALISMYAKCGSLEDALEIFHTMPERNVVSWTALIAAYAHQKHCWAFQFFQQMLWEGVELEKATLVSIINACVRPLTLEHTNELHIPSFEDNETSTTFLKLLLDLMNRIEFLKGDVTAWNNLLVGFARQHDSKSVLEVYEKMKEDGMLVTRPMFLQMLSACSTPLALTEGRLIHSYILSSTLEMDSVVGSALISMYSKCGALTEALSTFDAMPERDEILCEAMIDGYACHDGHGMKALELFRQMQQEGLNPTRSILLNLIRVCATLRNLSTGKLIHGHINESDLKHDIKLANALIAMYLECESEENARYVFDGMPERDVVSWNLVIGECSYLEESTSVFQLYEQMQLENLKPNKITFINLLKTCKNQSFLSKGKLLHSQVLQSGYECDIVIKNILITMYARCGDLQSAIQIFDKMNKRDVVTWNAMISAYSLHGQVVLAFVLFEQMLESGVEYDKVTLISILNSCTHAAEFEKGKLIHACIAGTAYEVDPFVATALITMYSTCGSPSEASRVFDTLPKKTVISWNAILAAYAHVGNEKIVFKLFARMWREGFQPDRITCLNMLKAFTSAASLVYVKQVHAFIVELGYESNAVVGTALLTTYGKCGDLLSARNIFDKIAQQDVVSWTAMISAYSQQGLVWEALELLNEMQLRGLTWNKIVFISIIDAFANLAALAEGKRVHILAVESGLANDVDVLNSLIHLYGKCGVWEEAKIIFEKMPERTVITWNTIIASSSLHGFGEETLKLLAQMQQEGVKANHITLISITKACNHAGLEDESFHYLNESGLA